MLRIAHVTPLYFSESGQVGGGERYVSNIAEAVASVSNGEAEVEIVSYGEEPASRSRTKVVALQLVPVTARGMTPFDDVSAEIAAALAGYDVVHIHQIFTRSSQVALLAAKFLRQTVVVSDHGGWTSDLDRSTPYLALSDCMLFYSEFGSQIVRGQPRERVVIPGGVDTRYYRPSDGGQRRDFFLFVGRLLPHKGVDHLIAALPARARLLVCGPNQDEDYFQHLRELARGKEVTFRTDAADDEVRELYRHALATILPSVHVDTRGRVYEHPELMGLTVLESLACGTPAIVSTAGALPEFVDDGRTGFVFADAAGLRSALERLRDDPRLADTLGAAGRREVERRYSFDVVGAALLRLYERLHG